MDEKSGASAPLCFWAGRLDALDVLHLTERALAALEATVGMRAFVAAETARTDAKSAVLAYIPIPGFWQAPAAAAILTGDVHCFAPLMWDVFVSTLSLATPPLT